MDVYLETVRQRTVRDLPSSRELFSGGGEEEEEVEEVEDVVEVEEVEAEEEIEEPREQSSSGAGLPSVRRLLQQFEGEGGRVARPSGRAVGRLQATLARQAREQEQQPVARTNGHSEVISPVAREVARTNGHTKVVSPVAREAVRPAPVRVLPQEEDQGSRSLGKAWDPLACVRSLYNLQDQEDQEVSLDPSSSCPAIEGYMERLPAGRRKSTLWNSWKRQYFVARAGVVSVYASRAMEELTDRLEIFGGQVDFMDSHMLGLEDRRGQYIVVRCASHKAAQEWEAALATHTREDFTSTFLRPWPGPPPRSAAVIVVDLGGASIRAGLLGEGPTLPTLYFPALMAANPTSSTDKYFGYDALKPEVSPGAST